MRMSIRRKNLIGNDPKTDLTFDSLDIKTGDELQVLSEALKKITSDER